MKLMIFFLIAVCLHVSAAGYGQKGTVTISGKDLPLEKVFNVIKKQTDYVCFYGYDVLREAKPVSLNFKDADVQEVLKAALWGQGLDFSITGKTITIMKKVAVAAGPGPSRTIKAVGVVYNEAGQPLSGANVTIKETGKGTITNAKGEFELPAVPEESPLVISFIGYAPQVVKVSEGTSMQVYLNVAKNELDKVVVQAYGTTTQRLATGNIATVSEAEIERQPVVNPLQALQGRVPGLIITQTNGYASAPFKVELRGRSIIDPSRASEPLYIIDGVPLTVLDVQGNGSNYAAGSKGFIQNGLNGPAQGQSPLFSLNPNDIESVTVLKDADATAIYGSRGANGVIIINTKKGKAGKTKLDMTVYQGENKVTQHYKMLSTKEYLEMRHEAFKNDGVTPTAGNAYDILSWDTTSYTDWQKFLWGRMGKTTNIQASLSGGDRQTTFLVSGAYLRQTGIQTVSGADQRTSIQFNLTHKSLNQRLNVSFTSAYSYTISNLTSLPGVSTFSPNAPSPFDGAGNLNWRGWDPIQNPFSSLLDPYTAKTGFLNSRLSLEYSLLKGLAFSTSLGYSSMHNSQLYLQPIISQDPLNAPVGQADFGNNNLNNAIVEPKLEYKTILSKGKLSALVGCTMQSVSQDGNHIVGTGYTNDNLLHSVSNAPTNFAIDNNGQYRYAAVFARINYNWDNRYIINMSARRDGSSRFGPGKQFGNFGSVGAAWVFTESTWFKNKMAFLSFGKIRGSYGITGSDNIGDYNYLTQWSSISATYINGLPSYIPLLHANPNLEWQVNKKVEGALDLGFLKDRVNFEFVWYQNRVGNQLLRFPLPILTGFSYVTANFPATIQNTGIESSIYAKIVDKTDFSLSLRFNIGHNINKLAAYPNIAQSPYASTYVVGQSLSILKLLHYTGIDAQTGLYTFKDKNHDGQINFDANDTANDLFNKDLSIKFDGGFGTDIQFKGWQLNLFFHFRKQPLRSNIASMGIPGAKNNFSRDILNRWQKPGDNAQFARYTTRPDISDVEFYNYSDGAYSDGSFIRLQNVALSYDFPSQWLQKIGLQASKVYVRGENIFIISKYKGLDPEVPFFGAMPPTKIVTLGLQFAF